MGLHSNLVSVGGEAPIERAPSAKFCIERDKPLCESLLWTMLKSYYSKMAIDAWSHNYVPSFVTSNVRLARTYARIIFNFLKDWYGSPQADKAVPVHILEIGAGHGRFSFLVVKSLLKYETLWKEFGFPDRPFVYVYSDVAEANVSFCMNHPMLKKLSRKGWVDFAVFDGNSKDTAIALRKSGKTIPFGYPLVVIANYVLDSLLTDAWKLTPGEAAQRALVSLYSVEPNPDITKEDIMNQVTISWNWKPEDLEHFDDSLDAAAIQNVSPSDYLSVDANIRDVLRKYSLMKQKMSFVLPVGAFSLFQTLLRLSGYNMFCLVGDKGYPTEHEFIGHRDPHIAVHGSISFMVNLHAIRSYFECIGGFSLASQWKDTFQITGLWKCQNDLNCSNSKMAFLEDIETMVPDLLTMWQKTAADAIASNSGLTIKHFLSLLRFSGHDADIFWNFRTLLNSQCVVPFINPRMEEDLLIDLQSVYKNWYRIRSDEDIADCCAYICMKVGRCDRAIYFFEKSLKHSPTTGHGTYVNMAACYKMLNNLTKAVEYCQKALELAPHFVPANDLMLTLNLCVNPIRVAFIGCGHWSRYEAIYLLKRDPRCKVVALFSFGSDASAQLKEEHNLEDAAVYYGTSGLKSILDRGDISGCIVDVHYKLMFQILKKMWDNDKHTLCRSPLSLQLKDVKECVDAYAPISNRLAWHCVDHYRLEEAFQQARRYLDKIGNPLSFSLYYVTDANYHHASFLTSPYTIKEHLVIELVRCLRATSTILGSSLKSVSAQMFVHSESQEKKAEGAEMEVLDTAKTNASVEDSAPPVLSDTLPVVSGWAAFGKESAQASVIGSFFITHKGGDNSINYRVFCTGGMIELKKFTSAWQIILTNKAVPQQSEEVSLQSVGHQNNHDGWIQQVCKKNSNEEASNEGGAYVDISISESLVDTAVAEGVACSIEREGCMANFGYKSEVKA